MEIELTPQAAEDLAYWKQIDNQAVLMKIRKLIEDIIRSPYIGKGNPKQLREELGCYWLRLIIRKHNFIYRIKEGTLYIYSLRGLHKPPV